MPSSGRESGGSGFSLERSVFNSLTGDN
jgi:hypothetical protein